jgi:hypothetical protein
MVTHAANNHSVLREVSGGGVKEFIIRDSTSLPSGTKRTLKPPAGLKRKAACISDQMLPSHAHGLPASFNSTASWRTARTGNRRALNAAAKLAERERLATAVQRTSERLSRPADAIPACERLAALRARILARALA